MRGVIIASVVGEVEVGVEIVEEAVEDFGVGAVEGNGSDFLCCSGGVVLGNFLVSCLFLTGGRSVFIISFMNVVRKAI